MTSQKVIETHQLVVTFDLLEDGTVNWSAAADEEVAAASNVDYATLAQLDTPLSAMGIRVLWDLCGDYIIQVALERASLAQWQEWGARMRHSQVADTGWEDVEASALG